MDIELDEFDSDYGGCRLLILDVGVESLLVI